MRRVDQLISTIRRITDNLTYTETSGIQDDEFIQALNDAQDKIYSLIQNKNPLIFVKEKVLNIAAGQQNYPIPSDCYLGARINRVEYSNTGRVENYYPLRAIQLWERDQFETGLPYLYVRRANEILVQPAPRSFGTLRITYQYNLPRLDKRYGMVSTFTQSGSELTSLFLNTGKIIDKDPLIDEGYITIVDKDGNVKTQGIPITDIDASTGEVFLDYFVFQDGETISADDYVIRGKYASSKSMLPDICESYFIEYGKSKIQRRDSSSDSQESGMELAQLEQMILDSFADPSADVDRIPLISSDFLVTDWD